MDDLNATANPAWNVTGLRLGWRGPSTAPFTPYVGVTNLFDKTYVGSVVVNARFGRYYEPAPKRSLYAGLSVGR